MEVKLSGWNGAEDEFTGEGGGTNYVQQRGFQYVHQFDTIGIFDFICGVYGTQMGGTIVVRDGNIFVREP